MVFLLNYSHSIALHSGFKHHPNAYFCYVTKHVHVSESTIPDNIPVSAT